MCLWFEVTQIVFNLILCSDYSWALVVYPSEVTACQTKTKSISEEILWQSCFILFPCLSSEFLIKRVTLHLLRRLACLISKKDVNSHGLGCDQENKLNHPREYEKRPLEVSICISKWRNKMHCMESFECWKQWWEVQIH